MVWICADNLMQSHNSCSLGGTLSFQLGHHRFSLCFDTGQQYKQLFAVQSHSVSVVTPTTLHITQHSHRCPLRPAPMTGPKEKENTAVTSCPLRLSLPPCTELSTHSLKASMRRYLPLINVQPTDFLQSICIGTKSAFPGMLSCHTSNTKLYLI